MHATKQCHPKHATWTHSILLHIVSDYSSLLNVIRGYATWFLCYRYSIMHTLRIDFVNNDNICVCVHIYYEAVYVWFYRLIRCAQYSFPAKAVTLTVWQMALMFLQFEIYRWRWCSCSSTCTYFHVQANRGVWHTVFTIRRSPHVHILQHKRLPTELWTCLFLPMTMNSETKSIWRQQPHNTHYRQTIPQHRLEVCISREQVVCVATWAMFFISIKYKNVCVIQGSLTNPHP
jgi:hypothetical protein